MDAYVAILLDRGSLDADIELVRNEISNLSVSIIPDIEIPRQQILQRVREEVSRQEAARDRQMRQLEDRYARRRARNRRRGRRSDDDENPILGAALLASAYWSNDPETEVGLTQRGPRWSGPIFGYGEKIAENDPAHLGALRQSILLGANPKMMRGMVATESEGRFSEGKRPYASDVTGLGFGGWASAKMTDSAPTSEDWMNFFKSWWNRGSEDARFKARGGLLGEGVGEGIDYTETFMHMASRSMEKLSVDVLGRPAMMFEDATEELGFLFGLGGPRAIPMKMLVLREGRRMRIEGEREYNRWLNREYLPENAATMLEEGIGTTTAAAKEYVRAYHIIRAAQKGKLGVYSPSKVVKDKVGYPIGKGFADGIKEHGFIAQSASRDIVRESIQNERPQAYNMARTTMHSASSAAAIGTSQTRRNSPKTQVTLPSRISPIHPVNVTPQRARRNPGYRGSVFNRMTMPKKRQTPTWQMNNNISNVSSQTQVEINDGINKAMRSVRQDRVIS